MLELRSVSKTFDPGTPMEVKVIRDLSLTVNDSDFVTVIGGNGAGKSTMLNLISGNRSVDKGLILLNGFNVTRLSEHQRAPYFGRVFQDPMMGTASDMTILENLTLAYGKGRIRSPFRWSSKRKDRDFFIEQLKTLELGLENRLNDKVGLLSGGQRQALTLLMATIRKDPPLRIIKRDYVRSYMGDKEKAKADMLAELDEFKKEYKKELQEIKNNEQLSRNERSEAKKAAKEGYFNKVKKYDVTRQILLLDEHTAALDPKTAAKVLEITDRIVNENHMTTIMITHNMKDALKYGNRLIMMSKGKIVVDVSGEDKKKLTVDDLLQLFTKANKDDFLSDSQILG